MTEFTHNIAMIVPQAHWSSAGALISCISGVQSDLMQFGNAKYEPDLDACNAQAKQSHVDAVMMASHGLLHPSRPAFDTDEQIDMVALQAMIDSAQIITTITDESITPIPGALIVAVDIDAATLALKCGFVKVQGE